MLADPVLVLIDLQYDYCEPGYAVDQDADVSHVRPAVERASAFLERYRTTGRTPIFVRTLHDERTNSGSWESMYAERPYSSLCEPGTAGAEFVPEIEPRNTDVVVTKHRYSAFHNTRLETILSANDVDRLLVCGVSTDVCVESTVRDAYNKDYEVTVLGDCSAPSRPELREVTHERLGKYFGEVRSADEVERELDVLESASR